MSSGDAFIAKSGSSTLGRRETGQTVLTDQLARSNLMFPRQAVVVKKCEKQEEVARVSSKEEEQELELE